jgi:hypothetical protein
MLRPFFMAIFCCLDFRNPNPGTNFHPCTDIGTQIVVFYTLIEPEDKSVNSGYSSKFFEKLYQIDPQ